jgi:putative DNA primase/helicase
MSDQIPAPAVPHVPPPAPPVVPDVSDDANAERFAVDHRAHLRYRRDAGVWMRWQAPSRDGDRYVGGWWSEASTAEVLQLARSTARRIAEEITTAATGADGACPSGVVAAARGCRSRARIAAMVALAEGDHRLSTTSDEWDADPWMLNVANGTVDLRTGTLLAHRATDLITSRSPVVHDPEAECPTWDRFITEVTRSDTELAGFLQRAVGSSLTGVINDQVLFCLHGAGRNGKSTFLEVILELVGRDLGIRAERSLLLRRGRTNGGGPTGGQADLFGRRLVVTSETGSGDRLDESLVKDLTGGDRIRARQPHGRNFEFTPTHHIWMATNHLPRITGTDTGIWRRIRLVPFTAVIPDDRIDCDLGLKLRAELPGILNWAIQGCLDWQTHGLGSASVIDAATAGYRNDQDLLGVFLDECCTLEASATVAAADLYDTYRTWAETSGLQPLSKIALGRLLAQRPGITATQHGAARTRSWTGIQLRSVPDPF